MECALEALRTRSMSLYKAAAYFGIPSTTLWQRMHKAGIDSSRKDGSGKTWSDDALNHALEALRAGTISVNKASKEYNIPSSTLYKICKKESIKLAPPLNTMPPSWSQENLRKAFEAIKNGMSVMKAATEFGIPNTTLYAKCKKEGIELRAKSENCNWTEDDLNVALDSVRMGEMSINQASIHYSVPYSTLYNRFKKCALAEGGDTGSDQNQSVPEIPSLETFQHSPSPQQQHHQGQHQQQQ